MRALRLSVSSVRDKEGVALRTTNATTRLDFFAILMTQRVAAPRRVGKQFVSNIWCATWCLQLQREVRHMPVSWVEWLNGSLA